MSTSPVVELLGRHNYNLVHIQLSLQESMNLLFLSPSSPINNLEAIKTLIIATTTAPNTIITQVKPYSALQAPSQTSITPFWILRRGLSLALGAQSSERRPRRRCRRLWCEHGRFP